MQVRLITEKDFDAICDLEVEAYGLKDAIDPPYEGLCVESKGGKVLGYLLTEPREDEFLYVRALLVKQENRGQGLGSLLIERLQATGQRLLLRTEPNTPHLSSFYAKLGFQVTGLERLQSPVPGVVTWIW